MIEGSFTKFQKFKHDRVLMDSFKATSFKGNLIQVIAIRVLNRIDRHKLTFYFLILFH